MEFDPTKYGPAVARILALDENGQRLMPLTCGPCSCEEARELIKTFKPGDLFPGLEEPHRLAQDCETAEGELWHAILHRQEPDSGNAAYWFRKAGPHPIFTEVARAAVRVLRRIPD